MLSKVNEHFVLSFLPVLFHYLAEILFSVNIPFGSVLSWFVWLWFNISFVCFVSKCVFIWDFYLFYVCFLEVFL